MVPRPTAALPPLKAQPTHEQLDDALSLVEHLYAAFPAAPLIPSSSPAVSSDEDENEGEGEGAGEDEDVLRASGVERQWALSWALRLSGSFLSWIDPDEAERLHDRAARVVADAARIADEGALDRDFTFPLASLDRTWTNLGLVASAPSGSAACSSAHVNGTACVNGVNGVDDSSHMNGANGADDASRISRTNVPTRTGSRTWSITLRDEALPPATSQEGSQTTTEEAIASRAQDAATAVGLQTWAAAAVLCDYLSRFWIARPYHGEVRILELGAGTGLAGLLAGKMALASPGVVKTVLTDYHEKVLENLVHNIHLNFPADCQGVRADVLDWAEVDEYIKDPAGRAGRASETPWWVHDAQDGGYDLVLGADVMYSPEHAVWLASSLAAMIPAHPVRPGAEGHILCAIRDKGRFAAMQLIDSADGVFNLATAPGGIASHLRLAATYRIPKVPGLGRADEHGWVHWVFRRQSDVPH